MIKKQIYVAALAMCMMALPCMTALAAERKAPPANRESLSEIKEETEAETKTEDAFVPWVKTEQGYLDHNGTVMQDVAARGISVSKWQGDIDWKKVAADDVTFAWIRMGTYDHDGVYTEDPWYDDNMQEAAHYGVYVAPYVYFEAQNVDMAREAAAYVLENLTPYEVHYPVAVDVEEKCILSLPKQEVTDIVNAFCQEIQAAGYTPIIYSSRSMFLDNMDISQLPHDLWVARYGGDPTLPNMTVWQPTAEGRVNGIQGNVCLEFAFKNYGPVSSSEDDSTPGTWQLVNDKWYFAHETGVYHGWIKSEGRWYYMDRAADGAMVANTTMEIDGVSYTFDGSGALVE